MSYVCENCGREFEKGYGKAQRFCTRSCCASFNAKKGDIQKKIEGMEHARSFVKYDTEGGTCKFCGRMCKNQNSLRNHERLCKQNPDYEKNKGPTVKGMHFHKKQNLFSTTCKFCGKDFIQKPHDVITRHIKYFCRENPDRVESKITGYASTPEKEIERKKKISEAAKRNLSTGKTKAGYVMSHSSKRSYPEKYFEDIFKDIENLQKEYFVLGYWLDFAIPEKKIYIEIDGEQHFDDEKILEHDKIRTQRLEEEGWVCLKRVRWSNYQKLSKAEKVEFCNSLINLLKNY